MLTYRQKRIVFFLLPVVTQGCPDKSIKRVNQSPSLSPLKEKQLQKEKTNPNTNVQTTTTHDNKENEPASSIVPRDFYNTTKENNQDPCCKKPILSTSTESHTIPESNAIPPLNQEKDLIQVTPIDTTTTCITPEGPNRDEEKLPFTSTWDYTVEEENIPSTSALNSTGGREKSKKEKWYSKLIPSIGKKKKTR